MGAYNRGMDFLSVFLGVAVIVMLIVWFMAIKYAVELAKRKSDAAPTVLLWFVGLFCTPLMVFVLVIAMPDDRERKRVDKRLDSIEKSIQALQNRETPAAQPTPRPLAATSDSRSVSDLPRVERRVNASAPVDICLVRYCDSCKKAFFDGEKTCPGCGSTTLQLDCSDYAWKSGAYSNFEARSQLVKNAGGTYAE